MRMSLGRLVSAAALAAGIGAMTIPAAAQAAEPAVWCESGASTYFCDFTGPGTGTKWYLKNVYYPQLDNKSHISRTCIGNTSVTVAVVYYDAAGIKHQVSTQFVCNPGDWQ